ncbi:MAG: endonuclease/exonuclease/phosphatase family protein [Eubacterium sp.]|nr:endonuclease/exonuclease/phosphatase family protein [Eubacterium sp.]
MAKGRKKRTVLMMICILAGVVIIAAAAYVLYVFASYYRLEDNLELMPEGNSKYTAVPDGQTLTIVSYNVGFGAYSDDYTFFMDGGKESRAFSEEAVYQNLSGAMDVVTSVDPDIALIQEVDIDGTRSYHVDERTIIVPRMEASAAYQNLFAQNYDSPYLLYPFTSPHGANRAGIMTFSKYRITGAVRRSLPIETGLSKVLDLDRCYSKARILLENGRELIIYNHHLSAYTAKAETAETQLDMLVQDMQAEYNVGNYCLAGGDFNRDLLGNSPEIFKTRTLDDNWAKPVNMDLFTEDIQLAAPFNAETPVASCRNPDKPYEPGDFVVTVDGFIHSSNLEVEACDVIDTGFRWSDHNPVFIRVTLR